MMVFRSCDALQLQFLPLHGDWVCIRHDNKQWFVSYQELLSNLTIEIVNQAETAPSDAPAIADGQWTLHVVGATKDRDQTIVIGPYTRRQAARLRNRLFTQLTIASVPGASRMALSRGVRPRHSRFGGRWLWLPVIGLSALVCFGAFVPKPNKPAQAGKISYASTPDVATNGFLPPAGMKNLVELSAQVGIVVNLDSPAPTALGQTQYGQGGAKPVGKPTLYVFARPGQDLQALLTGVNDAYTPVIIPSGFQNDMSASQARAVSQAYCSATPDRTWFSYGPTSPLPSSAGDCDWQDRARLAIMTGAVTGAIGPKGADYPVFVAPNGAVHEGAILSKTGNGAQSLRTWLAGNARPAETDVN